MKKNLLIIILLTSSITSLAQQNPCIPDAILQDSTFGLWPDTIQNLPIAAIDTYYEEHIQIKTPATVGEVMGEPYFIDSPLGFGQINIAPLSISKINLVEINGLPDCMSTYISSQDSVYFGDDIGCVTMFGTPLFSDIGQYDIEILIDGEVIIPGLNITQTLYESLGEYEVIDGYKLVIQSEIVSIDESFNLPFSVSQNSPNPFSNNTTVEFSSDITTKYNLSIANILGEIQFNRIINARKGINKVEINASNLSSGIYFYSLSNFRETITKKMIINKF